MFLFDFMIVSLHFEFARERCSADGQSQDKVWFDIFQDKEFRPPLQLVQYNHRWFSEHLEE